MTALAMIPGIHDAFIYNFFSRFLTAIIGLVTAGLVNFMVLPPKYYAQLDSLINKTESQMYSLYSNRMQQLLIGKFKSDASERALDKVISLNNRVDTLLSYQKDELGYHKHRDKEWIQVRRITSRSHTNRLFITHLSNIIYLPKNVQVVFNSEERLAILKISQSINNIFSTGHFEREKPSASVLKRSVKGLDEFDDNQIKSHIIYEILLIYRILDGRYAK